MNLLCGRFNYLHQIETMEKSHSLDSRNFWKLLRILYEFHSEKFLEF